MNIRQPRNQRLVLAGIGVAAISYLYFFSTFVPFGHRKAAAEKTELEQSYKQLSADLSKARQSLNNLEEVERQYQVITSRWEVASELLPGEREVANLLRKVTLVGQQAGVDFVLFKPKPQIPGEIYTENPVEVKVVGSYHQVGSFLAEVANLDRIVNVTGLSLGALKDGTEIQTVEASCLATAYTMNPVPDTSAPGSKATESPAGTPKDPNQAESKGAKHEG